VACNDSDLEGSLPAHEVAVASSTSTAPQNQNVTAPEQPPREATAAPVSARSEATPSGSGEASSADGPRITLEQTRHHFGRLREDETRSVKLGFVNSGNAPLEIREVKTTCGCTAATLDRMSYAPGERGEVTVEFDPSAPGDNQRKYVTILSNDVTNEGVAQIEIVADVDAFVVIEPRIVQLGTVELRKGSKAFVDVGFPSAEFVVDRVSSTNEHIAVRVLDERRPDGDPAAAAMPFGKTVEITVSPSAPWGGLFGWLDIVTSGPAKPGEAMRQTYDAKMRVQGAVYGLVHANDDTFRFGAERNTPFTRKLRLRRPDGQPLNILSSKVDFASMPGSTVSIVQVSPSEVEIVLNASGAPAESQYRGAVVVKTDAPGEETITLPIVGVIRPTPRGAGR